MTDRNDNALLRLHQIVSAAPDLQARLFDSHDAADFFAEAQRRTAFQGLELNAQTFREVDRFEVSHLLAAAGIPPPAETWHNSLSNAFWTLSLTLHRATPAMGQHENGQLVNYVYLPGRLDDIARHFGVATDAHAGESRAAGSGRHAKWHTTFRRDPEEKPTADNRVRELSERWFAPPFDQLEELRLHSNTATVSQDAR